MADGPSRVPRSFVVFALAKTQGSVSMEAAQRASGRMLVSKKKKSFFVCGTALGLVVFREFVLGNYWS